MRTSAHIIEIAEALATLYPDDPRAETFAAALAEGMAPAAAAALAAKVGSPLPGATGPAKGHPRPTGPAFGAGDPRSARLAELQGVGRAFGVSKGYRE